MAPVGRCPRCRRNEIPVLPRVAGRDLDNFVHEFHERALGTSGRGVVDESKRGHDELLVRCVADARLEPRNIANHRPETGTNETDQIIATYEKI